MAEATEMQQMEMEMVQGMYDTFELLSTAPPKYSVQLAPSADHTPELKVTFTYSSELYPEEATCEVEVENIAKHRRIMTKSLMADIDTLREEYIGAHVVLMILQTTQEFLANLAEEEEKAELQRQGEALNAAAGEVAHDPTIRQGTAVTKELFAEWSKKHFLEKERREKEYEKAHHKASASALTGRQLWDNTLRSAEWDLFDAGEKDNNEGEDVDYSLAQDELDEDCYNLED